VFWAGFFVGVPLTFTVLNNLAVFSSGTIRLIVAVICGVAFAFACERIYSTARKSGRDGDDRTQPPL
jgi:hypothetical protein